MENGEGAYTLKPYNIRLSPLIDPALGIDRLFSFSTCFDLHSLIHGLRSVRRLGIGLDSVTRAFVIHTTYSIHYYRH